MLHLHCKCCWLGIRGICKKRMRSAAEMGSKLTLKPNQRRGVKGGGDEKEENMEEDEGDLFSLP